MWKLGKGLRGNKKYYRNPELAKKEENGANKRRRGITRRIRIGGKPTQSSEQITRNEMNTCKGAESCWGLSTLAGAAGGWTRAWAAGTAAWTGTWASAITRFCTRRILTQTGPKWDAELLFILTLQGTGANRVGHDKYYWIVFLAKYPFISNKYANYQIPLKSSFDAP